MYSISGALEFCHKVTFGLKLFLLFSYPTFLRRRAKCRYSSIQAILVAARASSVPRQHASKIRITSAPLSRGISFLPAVRPFWEQELNRNLNSRGGMNDTVFWYVITGSTNSPTVSTHLLRHSASLKMGATYDSERSVHSYNVIYWNTAVSSNFTL
jgi:hypothetical protein